MASIFDQIPDVSFIGDETLADVQVRMVENFCLQYEAVTGKPIVLAAANPWRLTLYACALEEYQAHLWTDYQARMNLLKYAVGEYLDNIAVMFGVIRNPGSAASATVRFTLSAAQPGVVAIPEGTRVSNGAGLYFATEEYAEIPAGDLYIDLPVRCTEIGTAGNGLVPGQLGTLVDLIGYVANVQNTTATAGGTDVESDDDLRLRVYYAAASYSVAGPEDAYNYFVRSFSSDISDVRVTNPAPVEVAIYVVLNDATLPGTEFLARLEEYLQDGQIRPLSDRVSVLAPTAKNYTFDITYYVNQSDKASAASIQADVEKAISNYIRWQGSVIGRDINPDKLRNFVLSAGAKRCEITGMTFTQTAETEIPVLSAHTVTYGGLEDD